MKAQTEPNQKPPCKLLACDGGRHTVGTLGDGLRDVGKIFTDVRDNADLSRTGLDARAAAPRSADTGLHFAGFPA